MIKMLKYLWDLLPLFSVILFLELYGCSGWSINGIPAERFNNATKSEFVKLIGGVAVSNLVHFAGHYAYCEATGKQWHVEGWRYEIVDSPMSRSEQAMMGRAGFIAQWAGGAALNAWGPKESFFVAGYNIGTAFKIATYPILEGEYSDLDMIEKDSNSALEYGLYTTASIMLLR